MIFLREDEVLFIHQRQTEQFGGTHGIRDAGLLSSAIAAAENRFHYEAAGVATCAATYAYHLTQAHAFVDGNKRVGAAVAEVFLIINGASLAASNEEIIALFLRIAASEISRDDVERWYLARVKANS
jgi:death-on-curing protein